MDRQQEESATTGKKAKKASKDPLRKALAATITECPPLLIDHALHVANFNATLKPEQVLAEEKLLDELVVALQGVVNTSAEITSQEPIKGYILAKQEPASSNAQHKSEEPSLFYQDFHPFRPQQFENSDYTFLEFAGFNKTVDTFFSSIEGQKLESRLAEREQQARGKLEKARKEHAQRIDGLQQVQNLNFRRAETILANVHRVGEVIMAVNSLIATGMDWAGIAQLIQREQTFGNPVAQRILLPLKLHENTVTMVFDEANPDRDIAEDEEGYETSSVSQDSDDENSSLKGKLPAAPVSVQPPLAIDIDLGLSAWANAAEYFDQKKKAASKEDRTLQASTKALKSHEKKVTEDLKKGLKQEKEVLRPIRKQQWFEKYVYFISSDGYLILGGKDAQQNEIVYRRFLRKGDVYVHADLKGAVPLIIKNNPSHLDAPIPPSTLSQAGHLSICTSEAWDSKAVMSAWWVRSEQVSKLGHTGEYLPVGMFNIKGTKEYLPPAQLVIGLAVMFEISEASKANHQKHRIRESASSSAEMAMEETKVSTDSDPISKDEKDESDYDGDEFPDAKIDTNSEDEFPDAEIEATDDSESEPDIVTTSNPLQSQSRFVAEDGEPHSKQQKTLLERASDKNSAASKEHEGVDASLHAQNDEISEHDSAPSRDFSGYKHLSAKERRLLKKGNLPATAEVSSGLPASLENNQSDEESIAGAFTKPITKGPETVTTQASRATNGPVPRGKRGKAKKLAMKYANQDEDDRALAMRLLGFKSGQQAAEKAAQEKRQKEEQTEADRQRRRDQHLRAQAAGKAAEEARRAALENASQENQDEGDEVLQTNLHNLDAFTGRPLPSDEILSAIPVCAPWTALSTYKYKAKIQPGSTKRGKAVKEILTIWDHAGKDAKAVDKASQDMERLWPKEIELIRSWKEMEVVGVVPVGKVRVMIAGGRKGADIAKGKAANKSKRGGRGSKK